MDKFLFSALIILPVLFSACDTGQRVDSKQVQVEMEDRKIRRINKEQFTQAVLKYGDSIALTITPRVDTMFPESATNGAEIVESDFKESKSGLDYELTYIPKFLTAKMLNIPKPENAKLDKVESFVLAAVYASANNQLNSALVQQGDTNWVYANKWEGNSKEILGLVVISFPLKPLIRKMNIEGVD